MCWLGEIEPFTDALAHTHADGTREIINREKLLKEWSENNAAKYEKSCQ